tara:strand:+ start:15014 stop:16231 length:1218 start_codon:yes stop_codon:yes gene_type:complete
MKKKNKKRSYKSKYKIKKYAAAGMYNDNTVAGAGQSAMNSTANIVFQESDPNILKSKLDQLEQAKKDAMATSEQTASDLAAQDQADQQSIAAAAAEEEQKFQKGEALLQQGKQAYEKFSEIGSNIASNKAQKLAAEKAAQSIAGEQFGNLARQQSAEEVSKILADQTVQKGAELSLSGSTGGSSSILSSFGGTTPGITPPGVTAPVQTLGSEAVKTGATQAGAEVGKEVVKQGAGKFAGVGGAGAAGTSGFAKFATSGAGIGTIASIAGTGIKMLSDDNDPTKSNFGEYSGAILSSAGTGASIGSFLGPVGTAVGAGVGAIYGAGKQFFATKKAKKEADRLARIRKKKVADYNKKVTEQVSSAMAQARAGELEQKTYSGYDLGRNVVARNGGMRMGIPRYGFKMA